MVAVLGLSLAVHWGCQPSGVRSRFRTGSQGQGAILDQWAERISSPGPVPIVPPVEDHRGGES